MIELLTFFTRLLMLSILTVRYQSYRYSERAQPQRACKICAKHKANFMKKLYSGIAIPFLVSQGRKQPDEKLVVQGIA